METAQYHLRSNGLHQIIYNADDVNFFMELIERDNANKKSRFKYTTTLLDKNQQITTWTSAEWITDADLETEVGEAMGDPLSDFLIWLLRLIGKRFNRPFGLE